MTYFSFLAVFLGIPLVLMALATWRDAIRRRQLPAGLRNLPAWIPVVVHILVAVVYTTPWDNYLVATGVWYYNPRQVTGLTLGWVPVEEYTFFVLQSCLSGLWLLWLARRLPESPATPGRPGMRRWASLSLMAAWTVVLIGWLSGWQAATYLSLILVWALPPIALQMYFGADLLWRYRRLVLLAIASVTTYLALADSLAIGAGIWTISPQQSFHLLLGGVLPVEELIFFLVTNILIVFGSTLTLTVESRARARELFGRWRAVIKPGLKNSHTETEANL